jgi:DNA repair protein RadA/Sms
MVLDMAKLRLIHRCSDCGSAHPKWSGRCPSCGAWNSLVEDVESDEPAPGGLALGLPASVARPIAEVDAMSAAPVPSGIPELDRVLGGGFVPGSVTLVGGEPGVGKSTLLLQVLAGWSGRTLYVSAEESAHQVRSRAERLAAVRPDLWLVSETSLPHIVAGIEHVQPSLVVVDSIQTVADPELGSSPGSVTQVKACAQQLVSLARRLGVAVVLVGHVTKDGALAGPRVLEHVVDTVLSFDGDRHHALRLLRAAKHRFGSTNELGVFEMGETGLVGVDDPSRLFLLDRRTGVPGSAVVATLEGHRPLLVEVQSLAHSAASGAPARRTAHGLDPTRLAMLMAVLERRARVSAAQQDVYASVVGGVRLAEPGTDLGVCAAVASALVSRPIPADLVVVGEVGLAGELRQVGHAHRRLAEAARLGFRRAIVPESCPDVGVDIRLERVRALAEALVIAGLIGTHIAPGDETSARRQARRMSA